MSGECDKCGEHCLDCACDNYQSSPAIKSYPCIITIKDTTPPSNATTLKEKND